MIKRGDKVKLSKSIRMVTYLLNNAKALREASYEVKYVIGDICIIDIKGKPFEVHEKFLTKWQ